jgi:hypothetical protein
LNSKTITIENPTASENAYITFFNVPISITQVRGVIKGTGSVTYNIMFGPDRSATGSGTPVCSSPAALTNTTGGVDMTLNNTNVPVSSHLWLTTSAASGATELAVTIFWS